jgi:pyridoxine kinase
MDGLPSYIRPSTAYEGDSEYDSLLCVSSSYMPGISGLSVVHAQYVPLIPGYFSGVGDLFSALLLGHFDPKPKATTNAHTTNTPVSEAASQALTKTHAVLRLTFKHSESLPEDERQSTDEEKDEAEPERLTKRMRGRELRLVQGQNLLRGIGLDGVRTMEHWLDFWKA